VVHHDSLDLFDDLKIAGDGMGAMIINYSTGNRHEDIAVLSDYYL
jgi:hypothetical protein